MTQYNTLAKSFIISLYNSVCVISLSAFSWSIFLAWGDSIGSSVTGVRLDTCGFAGVNLLISRLHVRRGDPGAGVEGLPGCYTWPKGFYGRPWDNPKVRWSVLRCAGFYSVQVLVQVALQAPYPLTPCVHLPTIRILQPFQQLPSQITICSKCL